ncbi:DNA polymerase-3 subunit epsilon [Brevibacterium sanguinis]|uniref:DNA polymerase-3 subunit epsilon n=2 Tax=Brevibacterium TaxID=1696 RepID=A0A366IIG8_9MICO|nr:MULTISPECIES: DEDD exonuclease domain-containing protein [Brevibacterium]RBP64741.1 DNA polymerase-3 subunit epsilon [Brevibacterium sanguinis]RBP71616.1 DNA polymerase-3 subunit epsilon [Brevibacterium celere]
MSGHTPFDRAPSAVDRGQLSFDSLGTPLHEVTFVVVDLETTGTTAGRSEITEIGAVKTRGGEVIGEFQSLVKPEESVISPFVARLTGITHALVDDAPSIRSVLPSFLEFAVGSVLVAHNAPFDIGFLRAACERLDYHWPRPTVLDTVTLSRRVLGRDEVRNHKLATLAAHFGTAVEPDHRALSDARATSEVLHRLLERFGGFGVTTLEDLATVRQAGWAKRQAKSHLAAGVPAEPGVYMFLDGTRRVLYIGKSGNMARRVRGYFNASENRGRMAEMITAAQEVSCLPCAHSLEAEVREVRLIGELAPPYNRRSKNPERNSWIALSGEDFPRLSVVRSPAALERSPAPALGPFRSRKSAQAVKELLDTLYPVRRCTTKIRASRLEAHRPCVSAQVGQCGGPCSGVMDRQAYLEQISGLVTALGGDLTGFRALCAERMARLSGEARYESAAEVRDAMRSLEVTTARAELSSSLRGIEEILAWAPGEERGIDLAVIRHGRLAGAGHVGSPGLVDSTLRSLRATAEWVPRPGRYPAPTDTLPEETRLLARWLEAATPVVMTDGWALPRVGAASRGPDSGSGRLGDGA